MNRYLIAVSFEPQSEIHREIQSMRYQYAATEKFQELAQLPLIAPFTLPRGEGTLSFINEVDELLKTFFFDRKEEHFVNFNSLELYKSKRKYLLYLDPLFSTDFQYFLESLGDMGESHLSFTKSKRSKNPYLVLGKFLNEFQAVGSKLNIQKNFSILGENLPIKSINLLRNVGSEWRVEHEFMHFDIQINQHILDSNENIVKLLQYC